MRWVEALLRTAAYATTLFVAWHLAASTLTGGPQPDTRQVIKLMAAGALLPYAAAAVLRRTRRIHLAPGEQRLAGLRAWRLPLPAPGFRLLPEGGGHRDVLLAPAAARALGATGAGPAERFALHWPAPSPRWLALKFGLYPLIPALVIFRLNQLILYGGFLGEYHFYGLARWATSLLLYWGLTVTVMAAWAAAWRVAAEAASLLGAWTGPRAARGARRGAEIASALAYYAAVPIALAAVFLR